jgi:uncharacterized membrane protein
VSFTAVIVSGREILGYYLVLFIDMTCRLRKATCPCCFVFILTIYKYTQAIILTEYLSDVSLETSERLARLCMQVCMCVLCVACSIYSK